MEWNLGPGRVDLISLATTPDDYDLHNKWPKIFNQKLKRRTLNSFLGQTNIKNVFTFEIFEHFIKCVLKILNTFKKPTTFKKRTPFQT